MKRCAFPAVGLFACATLALSCARTVPAPFLQDRAQVPGYEWPPRAFSGEEAAAAPAQPVAARQAKVSLERDKLAPEPTLIAFSEAKDTECLSRLRALGVRFSPMEELRGVQTPIEIQSSLGGVAYWVTGNGSLRMDCRFALVLTEAAPVLLGHGITRVRYSGAYVYKTAVSGRLSHHAFGVAIDLHDFQTSTGVLSVKKDFRRGAGCGRSVPRLNRLACDLKAQGVFEEFLTPDFNAAHRDHLHLSVSRP